MDAVDTMSRQMQGAPLAELPPDKQDAVVSAIEKDADSAAFFALVRRLTLEGMFSDPAYGGNRNFAGWDLIRYPARAWLSPPTIRKWAFRSNLSDTRPRPVAAVVAIKLKPVDVAVIGLGAAAAWRCCRSRGRASRWPGSKPARGWTRAVSSRMN